jgi:hypothetical protein
LEVCEVKRAAVPFGVDVIYAQISCAPAANATVAVASKDCGAQYLRDGLLLVLALALPASVVCFVGLQEFRWWHWAVRRNHELAVLARIA